MVGWIFSGPEILFRERSLYEKNRLFLGSCIDNLGFVVIIRGGGIL